MNQIVNIWVIEIGEEDFINVETALSKLDFYSIAYYLYDNLKEEKNLENLFIFQNSLVEPN